MQGKFPRARRIAPILRFSLLFVSLLLLTSYLSLRADSQCAEQVRDPDTLLAVSKCYLLHLVR